MTAIPFTRGVPSADMLPVSDLEHGGGHGDARRMAPAHSPTRPVDTCRCASGSASATASTPARVLLVNGSLQGVAFLAQHLFLGRGGVAITEDPTYDRTLISLRTFGAELVAVAGDPGRRRRGRAGADAGAAAGADAVPDPHLPEPVRRVAARGGPAPGGRAGPPARGAGGRGRSLRPAAVRGRAGADAARAGRRRQRRLLLLVHQDGGARHPHRLPGAARADGRARWRGCRRTP